MCYFICQYELFDFGLLCVVQALIKERVDNSLLVETLTQQVHEREYVVLSNILHIIWTIELSIAFEGPTSKPVLMRRIFF